MLPVNTQDRYNSLCEQITRHNYLYYEISKPEILDEEYDRLFREIQELEEQYPEIVSTDSPTQKVGFTPTGKFAKVKHSLPMLSLQNSKNEDEIRDFDKSIKSKLKQSEDIEYVCELKLDGVAVELIYKDGTLKTGCSRGDSVTGDDITKNIETIKTIPKELTQPAPSLLEVRGEVYLEIESFNQINKEQTQLGEIPYANPRNLTAGSLLQLDPRKTEKRPLKIFCYGIGKIEPSNFKTHYERLQHLEMLGLRVNNNDTKVVKSIEGVIEYYQSYMEKRGELPFEIDGVVIKVNNLSMQEVLGQTARAPVWARAYKFPPKKEETKVEKISLQIGRTGAVTPVADLKQVKIGGVQVKRASLHNFDELNRLDVRVGDFVIVERAGDVIPQIESIVIEKRLLSSTPYYRPLHCPKCHNILERDLGSTSWYCPNRFGCPDQSIEAIKHFVSRNAFNIEGLGEAIIQSFFEEGLLQKPSDIYSLEEKIGANDLFNYDQGNKPTPLNERDGWGEKSANNLFKSILSSKKISLDKFIFSLGIRKIGTTNAKNLAKHYTTIEAFERAVLSKDLYIEVEGIGEDSIQEIKLFFTDFRNLTEFNKLRSCLNIKELSPNFSSELPLSGEALVFTGKLEKMSRDRAKDYAEKLGAEVLKSVTKKTTLIVAGEDAGGKLEKAKKNNIKIISEDKWLDILYSNKVKFNE